jgi:hypothetical protein
MDGPELKMWFAHKFESAIYIPTMTSLQNFKLFFGRKNLMAPACLSPAHNNFFSKSFKILKFR